MSQYFKHLFINRLAILLSPKLYLKYLLVISKILYWLKYDSPRRVFLEEIHFPNVGKQQLLRVEFHSGDSLWLINPIRVNRLLKGIDHCGQRLLTRYGLNSIDPGIDPLTFIDIGANIGELSWYYSNTAQRVISFEPDPVARFCLEKNLLNKRNCTIVPYALGDVDTIQELRLVPDSADSSLYFKETDIGRCILVQVQVKRGDFIFEEVRKQKSQVVVKMDAEGYEPEVLRGMPKLLGIVRCIAIDTGPERAGETTSEACSEILSQSGLKVLVPRSNITMGVR